MINEYVKLRSGGSLVIRVDAGLASLGRPEHRLVRALLDRVRQYQRSETSTATPEAPKAPEAES